MTLLTHYTYYANPSEDECNAYVGSWVIEADGPQTRVYAFTELSILFEQLAPRTYCENTR